MTIDWGRACWRSDETSYRLGVPGFLTSKELRELGGFDANNGLRDQQTAFRWIKKYIAGFGGDPEAITAIGQSAGAGTHLLEMLAESVLMLRQLP